MSSEYPPSGGTPRPGADTPATGSPPPAGPEPTRPASGAPGEPIPVPPASAAPSASTAGPSEGAIPLGPPGGAPDRAEGPSPSPSSSAPAWTPPDPRDPDREGLYGPPPDTDEAALKAATSASPSAPAWTPPEVEERTPIYGQPPDADQTALEAGTSAMAESSPAHASGESASEAGSARPEGWYGIGAQWREVADQFRELGLRLTAAFRAGWTEERPENLAGLRDELRATADRLDAAISAALEEADQPETREHLRQATAAAREANETLLGEVRHVTAAGLRGLNAQLAALVDRLEGERRR